MIFAQAPHSMVILAPFAIKSIAKRLGASAVRNIELVTQVAVIAIHVIYAPILRGSCSGVEPKIIGMLMAIG